VCGIVGKVSARRPVDRALIDQMSGVLRHRGPDSAGCFVDSHVGLGIRRLAIIDLEGGDQPIFSEDHSVVVVLNGEIYNYRELRAGLRRRGHKLSTESDTEVIVHLYEDHGDACVDHLRGMFAFALWDGNRRRLLLARDRLGKKPLFYSARDGELCFASEPNGILQDADVPRNVDYAAIDRFLHYQYVPDPMSAFAAIRKLPPAHLLTWEDGQINTHRYWKLRYRPKLKLSQPEAQELLRTRLLEATRLRLRSDVPLGALLSGGVDSSAVVAAMAQTASGRVKTFSIGFGHPGFDETNYAGEVARLFDTDHHELRIQPSVVDVLPRLVWHYGEPFADHSAIPSFAVAELTRRHVTVALNGDGGDEDFAGYSRYVVADRANRLEWVPKAVWRRGARLLARANPDATAALPLARGRRGLEMMALSPWERYAEYMAYFKSAQRERLYRPDFAASLDPGSALDVVRTPYMDSDAENDVERLLDADVHTYLPADLLVKMDIATMAHSLEVRSPLLDHMLVETAARLPMRTKLDRGQTKRIFKDALRAWLPDHILDRKKMGFAVPLADWLRGPLRRLPEQILLDTRSLQRGMFQQDELRRLIDDHQSGRANNQNRLWALLQLELWLRTYVDPPIPTPLTLDLGEISTGASKRPVGA
jgi:asparagine synthase (glutamine-hydrolysing)